MTMYFFFDDTATTEKGRSMSVIRSDLPLNSNLAMHHAAARPQRTLSGTQMAATSSVSRMAAMESGWRSAPKQALQPLASAWAKTLANGRRRNRPRNTPATPMSSHFTKGDSSVPRWDFAVAAGLLVLRSPSMDRLNVGSGSPSVRAD